MPSPFRHVALIGKPGLADVPPLLKQLYAHLIRRGLAVSVEAHCADALPDAPAKPLRALGENCDLAIVIGGDGTFLISARELAASGVPLIGINLGRLGFLVDISRDEALARLDDVIDGNYRAEERLLLSARVYRGGEILAEGVALNDVVIHRGSVAGMVELITHIDGLFLNAQRADGLIVSTPTGSTAYALSGGGPILHPRLPAVVLVPVNPHTLTNRPIVVDADSTVEITFRQSKAINAQLSCDNQLLPPVGGEDRILIRKSPAPVTILHPAGYDFFEILRAKLNWSNG
jgi:NAD+ kinase